MDKDVLFRLSPSLSQSLRLATFGTSLYTREANGSRRAGDKNRTGAPSGFLFAFHSTVTNTASVDEDTPSEELTMIILPFVNDLSAISIALISK